MPGVAAVSTLRMDTCTIQEAFCRLQEARVEIESRNSNFTPTSSLMSTGENKMILWELFPLDGPW